MRILLSLMDPITPTAAVAAALLFAGVPAASWADAVGHVATLAGSAEVTGADGARSLQCGDPVFPGDTVETAEGSEIGILMGDTLAHVSAGSSLRVEDAEALELTKGRVRVLDAIDGEDRRSVRALDSVAAHRGNDTEVYIFDEKTGPYAMHCEWDAPLEVQRGEETSVAPPGSCLIAKRDEPLYPADAHPERISVGDSPCGAPIAFGPVADRFLPEVGTSPFFPVPGPPAGQEAPAPDPCDNPGSGCRGSLFAGVGDPPPGGSGGPPDPPAGPVDPPVPPAVDPPVVEPPPTGGGIPSGS